MEKNLGKSCFAVRKEWANERASRVYDLNVLRNGFLHVEQRVRSRPDVLRSEPQAVHWTFPPPSPLWTLRYEWGGGEGGDRVRGLQRGQDCDNSAHELFCDWAHDKASSSYLWSCDNLLRELQTLEFLSRVAPDSEIRARKFRRRQPLQSGARH